MFKCLKWSSVIYRKVRQESKNICWMVQVNFVYNGHFILNSWSLTTQEVCIYWLPKTMRTVWALLEPALCPNESYLDEIGAGWVWWLWRATPVNIYLDAIRQQPDHLPALLCRNVPHEPLHSRERTDSLQTSWPISGSHAQANAQ